MSRWLLAASGSLFPAGAGHQQSLRAVLQCTVIPGCEPTRGSRCVPDPAQRRRREDRRSCQGARKGLQGCAG